jgi:glycosyltransferase involved in cell wall biosynthesis
VNSILFIVPYPPEGASNRFRVLQYIPGLEREGIRTRVRPFYSRALWNVLYKKGFVARKLLLGVICAANRLLDLFRALTYDMVFIHRESFPLGPAWFERSLRLLGRKYVYDFDDAVFLPNAAHPNRLFARLKCPGKTATAARLSRVALAGNSYLADYARNSGAPKVEVLPTVVDTDVFCPGEEDHNKKHPVVVGWIGSTTTIGFLEPFLPVWDRVRQQEPETRLRIVGGSLGEPLPNGVECVPWSLEGELDELRGFDIGIMPMPDNPWTRGKCAFKAIEYMASAVPAVCSPVGMNLELIGHGRTGYLPENDGQWEEILLNLIRDESLRRRIGDEGRKVIERDYSLQAVLPRFIRLMRNAAV